jgi:hypothetical protein
MLAHSMSFHLPPNALVRVQLRVVPGQDEDALVPLMTPDGTSHLAGPVHGMTVPDHEDGCHASLHEAIEESADNGGIY